MFFTRCGTNQTCIFVDRDESGWVSIGEIHEDDPEAKRLIEALGVSAILEDAPAVESDVRAEYQGYWHSSADVLLLRSKKVRFLKVDSKAINRDNVDNLVDLAAKSGSPYPLRYDVVIRCLGFRHNMDLYAPSARPRMQSNDKYPWMTTEYESVTVPGLYFAGELLHGKDYKRSAGGFIHGFRYTTRALARIFDVKYHSERWEKSMVFSDLHVWPSKTISSTPATAFEMMTSRIMERINRASGPYQMVAVLGDGIVFQCPSSNQDSGETPISGEYLEEVPLEYFNHKYANYARVHWNFGYRRQRQPLFTSMGYGTLFQVHLWFYPGFCNGTAAPVNDMQRQSKHLLYLVETLQTDWVRATRLECDAYLS